MRCFRWHISIYTNKIELHRPRHCKNKREQFFSYTYGGLVSRTSRELRAITMTFSLPAFQQPIRSLVWSGPILASDNIREHMGKAKNGPDRRLCSTCQIISFDMYVWNVKLSLEVCAGKYQDFK